MNNKKRPKPIEALNFISKLIILQFIFVVNIKKKAPLAKRCLGVSRIDSCTVFNYNSTSSYCKVI